MTSQSRRTPSAAIRSVVGFLLLLVVLAPLTLWRSGFETSLWIDESYSLLLTSHPVDEVLARTRVDSNPPGYYLALKAWLKSARLAGFEPGILWARLLNVGLWVALAAAAWFGGRRLFGRDAGALLAWVVAGGAYAALVARELRGYGTATVCLFGAFLVLVAVSARPEQEGSGRGRRLLWGLWLAYGLSATLALWTHLLSPLVLAALALAWLGLAAARRRLERSALLPAAVGHALPLVLFSPWLVRVASQVAYLEESGTRWMTPPSLANLGRVFTFWYPLGRMGDPAREGGPCLVALGALGLIAVLAPVVLAAVLLARSPRSASGAAAGSRTVASLQAGWVLGLGAATLYVVAIWLLDRLDLAPTFHGPRYPVLAVHLWSAGLACLAGWAAARRGTRLRWVALAFVPWFVASGVGQVRAAEEERWGELSELKAAAGPAWPAPGETVYVMPPELAPFYRETLAALDARRIERLPCEEGEGGSAAILDLNFWPQLDRPRDHLMRTVLEGGRLGAEVREFGYPPGQPSHTLYRVDGLDGELLGELCRTGLTPPLRARMEGSPAKALPEGQVSPEHWSYVEVSPELEVYRWSTSQRTPVEFDRRLPSGDYVLHVVGYRPARPAAVAPVGFTVEGAGWTEEVRLGEGRFHLRFEVRWPGGRRPPVLVVEHPTWRSGGGDRPTLGFLFYGAWFAPAGPLPPP